MPHSWCFANRLCHLVGHGWTIELATSHVFDFRRCQGDDIWHPGEMTVMALRRGRGFDCCQASYPNYLELLESLESRESRESRTPDLDLDLESLMYVSREL